MKKNTFPFIIIAINFFYSSCSHKKKTAQLKFDIEQDIECISIIYPDFLGISMQLLKHDSLLLINDFRGDSLIHVFDVKNQRLIKKLIPVGSGPNELISPLDIHIRNNGLFVFCRPLYSMYYIPMDSLMNGNKNMIKKIKATSEFDHLYPLTDSLFIASGFFQKRYALINYFGEKINEFGEYPAYWDGEEQFSTKVRAMFHQAEFLKHPTKSMFLTYSSHILEIYDYSSNVHQPRSVKNILMSGYNYSYINDGTILSVDKGKDVERGIASVGCSSDYIYIVYNRNGDSGETPRTQIQVIDWQGHPVKILNPKKEITCLVIDEKEKKGYAIAKDPDDTLMYFNLYEK